MRIWKNLPISKIAYTWFTLGGGKKDPPPGTPSVNKILLYFFINLLFWIPTTSLSQSPLYIFQTIQSCHLLTMNRWKSINANLSTHRLISFSLFFEFPFLDFMFQVHEYVKDWKYIKITIKIYYVRRIIKKPHSIILDTSPAHTSSLILRRGHIMLGGSSILLSLQI